MGASGLPAQAAEALPGFSDWVHSGHSAARLVVLGAAAGGGGERQAAVQIRLDPGYLTYWREPGDAGLAPVFETSGSSNVAGVAIAYPAPRLLDEGGAQLFGYRDGVTFPLSVTLAIPDHPATLAVDLDYAVCAAICLPGKAALRLPVPIALDPEAAALIAAARAAVPRPLPPDAPGSPAVVAAVLQGGAAPSLRVAARATGAATLFVEGPEGWFFSAATGQNGAGGTQSFVVPLVQRPKEAAGPLDLRLTLTDASGAIETTVHVDAGVPKP